MRPLRSELEQAMAEGEGKSLRFRMDAIELELKVAVERTGTVEGEAGVKFWVFAGAQGSGRASRKREVVQTLKLRLTPLPLPGGESAESPGGGHVLLSSRG